MPASILRIPACGKCTLDLEDIAFVSIHDSDLVIANLHRIRSLLCVTPSEHLTTALKHLHFPLPHPLRWRGCKSQHLSGERSREARERDLYFERAPLRDSSHSSQRN